MRYRLVSSAIPMFVVLCGMSAGCSKDPNPKDLGAKVEKEVKSKEAIAMELAMNGYAAKDLPAKDPAAKELGAPDLPAKELVLPDLPKLPAQEIDAKEIDAKELPVDSQETKKDKDTTKEIKKDKEAKKDPGKEGKDTKKEPPEPTEFLGKNFAYWLKQIKDTDPGKREEAMKAVLTFGPKKAYEAVPEILTQLERHIAKKNPTEIDLAVRVNGIMALNTIFRYAQAPNPKEDHIKRALVVYKACLKDPQVILKVRAVQGLPYLGVASRDLIEDVITLVKDPSTWEVRKEAIQTLAILALDKKGVPHPNVMKVLRVRVDPEKELSYLTRSTAVQAIAMLTQDKMPLELYSALKDPAIQVRLTGLQSIAAVSGGLEAKKHLDKKDRKNIVDHLETYLSLEKDEILRIWTYAAIMTVTKTCTKADLGPVVKTLTNTTDPAVKMQALTVIALCEDKGKPFAYDSVLPLIHDENVLIAGMAMNSLISMHAYEAIPELKKITENKKANEVRKDTADDTILALEYQQKMSKEKGEKDKKTPEKK